MVGGIVPFRRLTEKYRYRSDVMLPMELGSVPENWLALTTHSLRKHTPEEATPITIP